MPQGGLDPGEERVRGRYASWRKRPESARTCRDRRPTPEPLYYDLPEGLAGKLWKDSWRGQRQTWFLARFPGTDEDVDIATPEPEFRAWKWADPATSRP